jgi:hypothetical protein
VNFSLKSEATEKPGIKSNSTKDAHPRGSMDIIPDNASISQASLLK